MSNDLLESLLESPVLPELIQEAQRALGREQALRRKFYEDVTPEHKWEFIQGEVVMHSPALNRHLLATQRLFRLMDTFAVTRQLGQVRTEEAMTSFSRNDYEPDIMFFGPAKAALIHPDTLHFPVPDLAVEVLSPSTEKRDRGVKFQDYALHGVAEYWIVDPVAETVESHRLQRDAYPPAPAQRDGLLGSEVIPGFEVPLRAIFDETENLATLKAFLASH